MNEKIQEILEFDKVKDQFALKLKTAQAKEELANLAILNDEAKIKQSFDELADFELVVQENGSLPIAETEDLSEVFKRLDLDANLNGSELARIRKMVVLTHEVKNYFLDVENVDFENLGRTIDKFVDLPKLQGILQVVDSSGHILDTASDKLFELRSSLKKIEADIRRVMQESLSKNASNLSENIITIRQDRPVLAVKVEAKSKVAGVIQDMSASGQTVYIEPSQVVSLNNNFNQKKIEEKYEIERILSLVSDQLRPYVNDLRQNSWLLGHLDLINAKYLYMLERKAVIPQISTDKSIMLYGVRHPLIKDDQVVANDINFGKDLNTIVITGPNTGGKTISLKTLGLAQLMAQSGLPILADPSSSVGIFTQIYADIGDEQSIEQNLSTFSSHMTNIVEILKNVDADSLVLFDELGAGTDPREGAALAISILDFLMLSHTKTMATTHYPELKAYGAEKDGVLNASMEFDLDSLRPTYRLMMGIPGRSNALEISKRLGLFDKIIDDAKAQISDDSHDVNIMIADLEEKNSSLNKSLANIRSLEKDNKALHKDLSRMYKTFNHDKEEELNKARAKAADILHEAKDEADEILKNLHEQSMLKPHEVIDAKAKLDGLIPETVDLSKNKVLKKAKAKRGLKPGAEVMVTSYGQRASLVKLDSDGKWQVQMGLISTKLSEDEFEVIETEEVKPTKKKVSLVKRDANKKLKGQLDLRGKRYEEAEMELNDYIDQALLNNMSQITIVHGIGTGVIREMVQKKLKVNRHIKSYNYAPQNAGGSGATIAELR